jgi:hypothetical protein
LQWQGLEFISQSWNDVDIEAPEKIILANFPDLNLTLPREVAEQVWRDAVDS